MRKISIIFILGFLFLLPKSVFGVQDLQSGVCYPNGSNCYFNSDHSAIPDYFFRFYHGYYPDQSNPYGPEQETFNATQWGAAPGVPQWFYVRPTGDNIPRYYQTDGSASIPLLVTGTVITAVTPPAGSVTTQGLKTISVSAIVDCSSAAGALDCIDNAQHTLNIQVYPVTSGISTSTYYSTSTSFDSSGLYTFSFPYSISNNGTFNLNAKLVNSHAQVYDSTSTQFVVGQSAPFDNYLASSSSSTIAFFNSIASTSPATCNFGFGLDLTGCFYYLFVPNVVDLDNINESLYNDFKTIVPISYAFRFVDIMQSTSTVSLPSLSFTMPSFNGLTNTGEKLDLTPWNNLMGTTSYLATATSTITGTTFLGDFMPYWTMFVQFCFGLAAIRLFIKFGGNETTIARRDLKTKTRRS